MKIVIAPDSFKESLSAPEVAAATMWMMNHTECSAGTSGATST